MTKTSKKILNKVCFIAIVSVAIITLNNSAYAEGALGYSGEGFGLHPGIEVQPGKNPNDLFSAFVKSTNKKPLAGFAEHKDDSDYIDSYAEFRDPTSVFYGDVKRANDNYHDDYELFSSDKRRVARLMGEQEAKRKKIEEEVRRRSRIIHIPDKIAKRLEEARRRFLESKGYYEKNNKRVAPGNRKNEGGDKVGLVCRNKEGKGDCRFLIKDSEGKYTTDRKIIITLSDGKGDGAGGGNGGKKGGGDNKKGGDGNKEKGKDKKEGKKDKETDGTTTSAIEEVEEEFDRLSQILGLGGDITTFDWERSGDNEDADDELEKLLAASMSKSKNYLDDVTKKEDEEDSFDMLLDGRQEDNEALKELKELKKIKLKSDESDEEVESDSDDQLDKMIASAIGSGRGGAGAGAPMIVVEDRGDWEAEIAKEEAQRVAEEAERDKVAREELAARKAEEQRRAAELEAERRKRRKEEEAIRKGREQAEIAELAKIFCEETKIEEKERKIRERKKAEEKRKEREEEILTAKREEETADRRKREKMAGEQRRKSKRMLLLLKEYDKDPEGWRKKAAEKTEKEREKRIEKKIKKKEKGEKKDVESSGSDGETKTPNEGPKGSYAVVDGGLSSESSGDDEIESDISSEEEVVNLAPRIKKVPKEKIKKKKKSYSSKSDEEKTEEKQEDRKKRILKKKSERKKMVVLGDYSDSDSDSDSFPSGEEDHGPQVNEGQGQVSFGNHESDDEFPEDGGEEDQRKVDSLAEEAVERERLEKNKFLTLLKKTKLLQKRLKLIEKQKEEQIAEVRRQLFIKEEAERERKRERIKEEARKKKEEEEKNRNSGGKSEDEGEDEDEDEDEGGGGIVNSVLNIFRWGA